MTKEPSPEPQGPICEPSKHGKDTPIEMLYKNHRGEVMRRIVIVHRLWFGKSHWHPLPGWFLRAYDLEKGVANPGERCMRDFALKDCDFRMEEK